MSVEENGRSFFPEGYIPPPQNGAAVTILHQYSPETDKAVGDNFRAEARKTDEGTDKNIRKRRTEGARGGIVVSLIVSVIFMSVGKFYEWWWWITIVFVIISLGFIYWLVPNFMKLQSE